MLPAISTTTAVSDWLRTAVSLRVLHVFDQVCNLVDGERRVISLVTPEIGKGPFSLVVDLAHGRFTDFIQADSPIRIQPTTCHSKRSEESLRHRSSQEVGMLHSVQHDRFTLRIGSLVVDTSGAKLWNARPLWETVSAAAIKTHYPLFEQKLTASSPDSLAHVNGRSDPAALKTKTACTESFGRLKTGRVEVAVLTLQKGLKTGDLAACQEGARGLAGLGVGLTPAGDDFLLGVIYGLWLTKEFSRIPVLSKAEVGAKTQRIIGILAEEAIARTTTLSGAWLGAAARGEAGQSWHELVVAMGDGRETTCTERVEVAVSQAIDHILETGHTSGADALAGFVMATSS